MRRTIVALLALVAACDAGMPINTPIDANNDRTDATSHTDVVMPPHDGSSLTDVPVTHDAGPAGDASVDVLAVGSMRSEICGNGFDDDGNGLIDDGCDCAVGTSRACWLGPPGAQHVGACHDGVQNCQSDGTNATWAFCADEVLPTREILANGIDDDCDGMTDESDGICSPRANVETGTDCINGLDDDCDTLIDCADPSCAGQSRCPGGCVAHETLCWGGVDEDCDGMIDCADSDCATDASCRTSACPPGQTPTYVERALGTSWGPSSIAAGDGLAVMPMSCQPGHCGAGEVAVALTGQMPICVPPPSMCPTGQSPTYVSSGHWRCDRPCEIIVHYGSIYGGRSVCTGRPMITCGSGTVPTFMQDTETWVCAPTCSNSLYDQISLAGMLVCVPC